MSIAEVYPKRNWICQDGFRFWVAPRVPTRSQRLVFPSQVKSLASPTVTAPQRCLSLTKLQAESPASLVEENSAEPWAYALEKLPLGASPDGGRFLDHLVSGL